MFDTLGDRLQDVIKRLRGQSRLDDKNIAGALSDIRTALLEADVNVEVTDRFVESVRESSIGADVVRSVTPGQQLVKIVHDKLVDLLGSSASSLDFSKRPAVFMLVGLHGSGKTTTAGKLALHLKKQGHKVVLVAGDVYRPAAIDQLEAIGSEIGVKVCSERTSVNVAAIAADAVHNAIDEGSDVVIIDTAGRLQIDEQMIAELKRISDAIVPSETLLVADAALGQEAVSVAGHFHRALNLSGVILTKVDGDSRAGAALSIREVTGVPIKFVGEGEKLDQLDIFHPDRVAGRILGMGDVVSLVERATAEIDEAEARRMQEKLRKNKFDYNDFLSQIHQLAKMGGLENVLRLLPGGKAVLGNISKVDMSQFSKMESIIMSMTPRERENPDILDFSRKKRLARGAGVSVETVGTMTKNFETVRRMARGLGGGTPHVPGGFGMPQMGGETSASSRKDQDKRRHLAKLAKKQRQKQRKRKK